MIIIRCLGLAMHRYCSEHFTCINSFNTANLWDRIHYCPILWMRTLRLRQAKCPAQVYSAPKQQSQDLNPGSLAFEPMHLIFMLSYERVYRIYKRMYVWVKINLNLVMTECVPREESKLNIERLKPRILGEWLIMMRKLGKCHCVDKWAKVGYGQHFDCIQSGFQ